jgi:hypothetical protein
MKQYRIVIFVVTLALAIGASITVAQVQKGKTRPLETKVWMKTINGPHCSALGKLLKAGPADDKEWEQAKVHAEMLNEAGHVLMADGRCPDAAWADGSKQLRESSDALLKDIGEKNATGGQANFQKLLGACKTCHSAHKK